jgi:hypothetical protein
MPGNLPFDVQIREHDYLRSPEGDPGMRITSEKDVLLSFSRPARPQEWNLDRYMNDRIGS